MRIKIDRDALTNIDLNPASSEIEVAQNLASLAVTPRGSVPLLCDMGMDMRYLDLPIKLAANLFEAELTMAADEYEKRAEITGISLRTEGNGQTLIPTVVVEASDE